MIGLLFLLRGRFPHRQAWQPFLDSQNFRVFVHDTGEQELPADLRRWVIPDRVPTRWQNLLRAELALLRFALTNSDCDHFTFLSDSCLPFHDPETTYRGISRSWMAYRAARDLDWRDRSPGGILKRHFLFAPQWILLSRSHAQFFANQPYWEKQFASRLFDTEHYFASLAAKQEILEEFLRRPCTFACHPDGTPRPKLFCDPLSQEDEIALREASRSCLFARKFAPDCGIDLRSLAQEFTLSGG